MTISLGYLLHTELSGPKHWPQTSISELELIAEHKPRSFFSVDFACPIFRGPDQHQWRGVYN
jgi:hypothetical protein